MIYKEHTIDLLRDSSGLRVRITGPLVNSQAGTFPMEVEAIKYARSRIDEARQ